MKIIKEKESESPAALRIIHTQVNERAQTEVRGHNVPPVIAESPL